MTRLDMKDKECQLGRQDDDEQAQGWLNLG